jgi:hypothetical protein
MTDWKNNLTGFLLFILVAAITTIIIDQLTDWPTWLKLAPATILTVLAFISLLGSTSKTTTTTATTAPAPAPVPTPIATPAPVASRPAAKTEVEKTGAQSIGELLGALILLAAVGGVIYGLIFLYGLMVDEYNSVRDNANLGRVNTEFLVGHSYNQREETEYDRRLKKDVIYDVFTLKKGQHWKWYFDKDIYYRIRADGGDDFVLLERLKHTGSEYTANYDGTLQVKSPVDYNHVTITRLVTY